MPGKPLMLHPQLQLLRTEPSIVIFGLERTTVALLSVRKVLIYMGPLQSQ